MAFITKKKFREFLARQPRAWTARRNDPGACPLAMATGYDVGSTSYFTGAGMNNERLLPLWAAAFVSAVDTPGGRSITRDRALTVLDSI